MTKRKCGITSTLRNFITKIKNAGKKQTHFLSVINITKQKLSLKQVPLNQRTDKNGVKAKFSLQPTLSFGSFFPALLQLDFFAFLSV